jgi:hypothetical protein
VLGDHIQVPLKAWPAGEPAAACDDELGGAQLECREVLRNTVRVVLGDHVQGRGVTGADLTVQHAGEPAQVVQAGPLRERDGRHHDLLSSA